jgi:hypothetical protein
MKNYRVKKTVMLTFLNVIESESFLFDVGTLLEANDHTIWLIRNDGTRRESIHTIAALHFWLKNGDVEEIT